MAWVFLMHSGAWLALGGYGKEGVLRGVSARWAAEPVQSFGLILDMRNEAYGFRDHLLGSLFPVSILR